MNRITLYLIFATVALTISACGLFEGFVGEPEPAPELPTLAPIPETAPGSEITVGQTYSFSGIVIDSIDRCILDGPCALVVETSAGAVYTVRWSEGFTPNPCQGTYNGNIEETGRTVEVFAEATLPGTLSICPGADYYITFTDGG